MVFKRADVLTLEFYARDPAIVAKELLAKRLVRRVGQQVLVGIIVETEAYYGVEDPASRAHQGKLRYNTPMWGDPGRVFIYNVHKYWMLNVVAHPPNQVGAVLIRAIEPTEGVEVMKRNRLGCHGVTLTNGPGKLTLALMVDKHLNEVAVTSPESPLVIVDQPLPVQTERSHRIGVRKDVKQKLRFFINGNPFVSK